MSTALSPIRSIARAISATKNALLHLVELLLERQARGSAR
jgi:hypothetical protein